MTEQKDKKHSIASNLIMTALVTFVCLYSYVIFTQTDPNGNQFNTSNRQELNILFIGNSFTFFNNMPKIIEKLSAYDRNSQFNVKTEMLVEGGASLQDLLNHPKAETILSERQWHYIVLQPKGLGTTQTSKINASLKQWENKINTTGALPVLFMTWPLERNSKWYKLPHASSKTPGTLFKHIKQDAHLYTQKHDMQLAPVGSYWMALHYRNPELNLYNPDGMHPSPKGSFLTALIFYKTLVNETLNDITYTPPYLNKLEKKAIMETVFAPIPTNIK